jgi:RNA polymerase sigma factor (sigma-70 family)
MVVALVRRLFANPDLVADVVQEAAVTALVGLGRLRSPERFGAWYAGIALNVARRWSRSEHVAPPLSGDRADAARGPDELAEAAELAQGVRRAVLALPYGQRQAVLAFYWQGLSHAEVAAELATSPGAVKSRLHQARAALAPELSPYAEQEREAAPVLDSKTATVWVEVEVAEVRREDGEGSTGRAHAVILAEVGGDRRLPVYIGAAEAVALACSLEAVEAPRPMTYQFAADLARAGGSDVTDVRVTTLTEHTFYAVVVLHGPEGRAEVDARPSDALNLALVCGVPVYVDAAIFDDPNVARYDQWQRFPTGAAELASEVRHGDAQLLTRMAKAANRARPTGG